MSLERRKFKLEIELVPEPLWERSLYHMLPREEWKRLWHKIIQEEGGKCYICGSTGMKLELHEFWEYDDENRVQKLVGMHLICDLCHMVKHLGYWCHTDEGRIKLEKRGLSRNDLIQHFCRVNNCSEEDFLQHEEESFKIWRERSKYDDWKQDLGRYKSWLRTQQGDNLYGLWDWNSQKKGACKTG